MADPILFKVFVSSPGDVPQERDDAEAVIKEINDSGEFSHHFILKAYRWDDKAVVLPMPVTDIPQKSVDIYMIRPSVCDLVIVLFWSRMGSPMVMDEREYLSGTHYEYSEGLQGYKQVGKPTVWLYRCAEEPLIKLSDPKRDEKIQQFDRVSQFFKQFQDSEGRYTGGVNSYDTHADFKPQFKGQLITYLRHLRDKPQAPAVVPSAKPKFTGIPYRGLTALDEGDAPIFFGREAETLEVLSRVEAKRLVFVLGASGSGKSSLVAAGVLPKLRERNWRIVRCVPGDDPFFSLALALVSQIPEMEVKPVDYLPKARKLADILSTSPENLAEQIVLTLPKIKVLLFIDQFEEIFTLAANNPQIPEFIQAIRYPSTNLTTLITMRADFYGAALLHFEELKQQAYGLSRPSPFALYEMITRPAEMAGLELDNGLAKQIVDEAGSESGGLALISYVLEALYLRANERKDKRLSKQDYEVELNGVQGAINTLADQAYANLPFKENIRQKTLKNVFRELVTLTEEDGQIIPTRRRTPMSSFLANSTETQFIEIFVRARLLIKDNHSVEVAHEAILRYWNKLAAWIIWVKEIKGDLELFRQYESAAKIWESRGKVTPQPIHETLVLFYKTLTNLDIDPTGLSEPLKSYIEPEASRLVRELGTLSKTDESQKRRYEIGDRLSIIGDPRTGIGLYPNGIPQIDWGLVTPGGEIEIEGQTFLVEPFYISKYLVTYGQFQAFASDPQIYNDDLWWKGMPKQKVVFPPSQQINYPRSRVSWYQAVAFTRWLNAQYKKEGLISKLLSKRTNLKKTEWGIRLPTEWEWQWAAQSGKEKREYPWGMRDDEVRANTTEAGINNRSTAVGMYLNGAANCGALDMAGNLWEWCLNDVENIKRINGNSTNKITRGGSFSGTLEFARTTYRGWGEPKYTGYNNGFRVVVAPLINIS